MLVNGGDFQRIKQILPIVPKGSSYGPPIFSTVLLEKTEAGITAIVTDLESFASVKIPVAGSKEPEGEFCSVAIPLEVMKKLLKGVCKDSTFSVSSTKEELLVEGHRSYKVKVLDAEDFPLCEVPDKGESYQIDSSVLMKALDSTLPFVSTDEARGALQGVFVENRKDDILSFTGTDGWRVSRISVPGGEQKPFRFVAPAKGLKVLKDILISNGEVEVKVDNENVLFSFADFKVWAKNLEFLHAEYPSVEGILGPIEQDLLAAEPYYRTVVFDRKTLIKEIEGVLGFDDSRCSRLRLTFGKSAGVELATEDSDGNEASVVVRTNGGFHEEFRLHLNPRFLIDGLKILDGFQVVFGFKDKRDTCFLKSMAEKPQEKYIYLLQPLDIGR